MTHDVLHYELERVALRHRTMTRSLAFAIAWALLALAGAGVLLWSRAGNRAVPGIALVGLLVVALFLIPILRSIFSGAKDPARIARWIENRFPDLDARLLAAVEQKPAGTSGELGYLQQSVIREAHNHAKFQPWESAISGAKVRGAQIAKWTMFTALLFVFGGMVVDITRHRGSGGFLLGGSSDRDGYAIKIEPEDANIERGSSLLVLARFSGKVPGDVRFEYVPQAGETVETDKAGVQQQPMSKSLDDPVFAARVPSVNAPLTYKVHYGDGETRWFKVDVFDYPELKQADANLKFPEYTGLEERKLQDTRSITAVEGTKATITFKLNKPVSEAKLLPSTRPADQDKVQAVALKVDPNDPSLYSISMDLNQSQNFKLQLVDADGRKNKREPELAIRVNPNRLPELKAIFPAKDVDVSPIQELSLKENVWDDFGVKLAGVTYSIAGEEPHEVTLTSAVPAKEKREVTELVSLEKLSAEPDQLLSYYFWAEDIAADGSTRRVSSDMFFAEVRPFEQIFRQGQQPSESEQQQQQGQSQNGQQAEELAELQKQVIAATWKVMRRETSATPTLQFAADANLIVESQVSAREQAAALGENLTDARSATHLKNVLKYMDQAITSLKSASSDAAIAPLARALPSEQSAYQELLKLRAREYEVVRSNQRQQQSRQQSASSASSRRQQQLDQLRLDQQEQNRYETQRQAAPQQEDNPQQRETRQVLNRLKELAQRQEDLNRQMRELQSALEQAQEKQQREELERQLARLRDQQQQQLRDTDELRDRMDQPENQERMAESREQLENTRENVRRASESLEKGMVPEAQSSGARAGEELSNLRDEFRRNASGQFNEAVTEMRDEARQLDENQKAISQKLQEIETPDQQRTLRGGEQREALAKDLAQQKDELSKLLEQMKQTVEQAETSEPLLSKNLYDAMREAGQQKTEQALDAGRQLLERGFTREAKQAEGEAGKGITRLREGVEQAAQSVLGDETEALRRARGELERLTQELQREVEQNRSEGSQAGASPSTRPANGRSQMARGGPTTQESGQRSIAGDPTTRNSSPFARGNAPSTQQSDQATRNGRSPATQPGEQVAGGDNQGRNGDQRSTEQQPGDPSGERQSQGQQQQAQSGAQQPGAQQGQPGSAPGQGQQPGQPGEQPQAGDPQRGTQPGEGQNPGETSAEPQSGSQRASAAGQSRGQGGAGGGQRGNPQGDRTGNRDDAQGQDQATQNQPESNQPRQDEPGQGQPNPDQPNGSQPSDRTASGEARPARPGVPRELAGGDERGFGGNPSGGGGNQRYILTGEGFRDWSDRLRDVEEMMTDPRLRAEAARIRERARDLRADFTRHSKAPNWDMVNQTINQPLAELRDAVNQELLRKDSREALVPIDREPVPPKYADQVRKYYERLGAGR